MTKREFLLAQIKTEKMWLKMLIDNSIPDYQLGLPKNRLRRQEIDDSLDRINEYREQLKRINDED